MELLIPVSLIENFHFLRPLWLARAHSSSFTASRSLAA
jgi:hypothetical protein